MSTAGLDATSSRAGSGPRIAGEPVEVYHPENRFDYVFSGDVADGLLRMALEPRASGAINLATGRSRTARRDAAPR